jgi:hypothetical protein
VFSWDAIEPSQGLNHRGRSSRHEDSFAYSVTARNARPSSS